MVQATNKKQTDFITDLEPLIKKCGLENDADCKENIEMVKKKRS